MTTIEEKNVAKFVLWGGPEDGLEVDVLAGNMQVTVDSPSAQSSRNRTPYGQQAAAPLPPQRQARYQWSTITRRFEWKGYL
jgi:hypothetical protein